MNEQFWIKAERMNKRIHELSWATQEGEEGIEKR